MWNYNESYIVGNTWQRKMRWRVEQSNRIVSCVVMIYISYFLTTVEAASFCAFAEDMVTIYLQNSRKLMNIRSIRVVRRSSV